MEEATQEESQGTAPAGKEGAEEAPRPRRRPRTMRKQEGPTVEQVGSLEVRVVNLDGACYVQRYVRCGKKCRRCGEQHETYDPQRPGHGPYWYRLLRVDGRVVRRYIGKEISHAIER